MSNFNSSLSAQEIENALIKAQSSLNQEEIEALIPTNLPNPNSLIINGKEYDGTVDVVLDIAEESTTLDSLGIANCFIQGKEGEVYENLLNEKNFLYGKAISGGKFINVSTGIMSNKIYAANGDVFTAQGIQGFGTVSVSKSIFVGYFAEGDIYRERFQYDFTEETEQITTFTANSTTDWDYMRIVIQYDASGLGIGGKTECQLVTGNVAKPFIPQGTTSSSSMLLNHKMLDNYSSESVESLYKLTPLCVGASFVDSRYNQWFEIACKQLNVNGINRGLSGSNISDAAIAYKGGSLITTSEFSNTNCLVIFHSHNVNVSDDTLLKENYLDYTNEDLANSSAAYDYILKRYTTERFTIEQPAHIIVLTHWHDSRSIFNDSIRTLKDKWGFTLLELDKEIGFSKNQELESIQPSTRFAVDTETIGEVVYGWHPLRTEGTYIQDKLAKLFINCISKL